MANKRVPDVTIAQEVIHQSFALGDPNYNHVIAVLKAIMEASEHNMSIKSVLARNHQDSPAGRFELKAQDLLDILNNDSHRRVLLDSEGINEQMLNVALTMTQAVCWTHS